MTIIEALKSGKKFGRREHGPILTSGLELYLTKEDILATDWVVKEEKIEITRNQFLDLAYEEFGFTKHSEEAVICPDSQRDLISAIHRLKIRLGFKS